MNNETFYYENYENENKNELQQTKMIQSGGEKLSEGGYGCVYYPGLSCDGKELTGNDAKKYISKVQLLSSSARNEIHISHLIKQIPFYDRYFVPIIEHCQIEVGELDKGLLRSCDLFKEQNIDVKSSLKDKFSIMKMNYVDSTTFTDYIDLIDDSKKMLNTIIESYKYLLIAIQKLYNQHIIHYDLKGENILYHIAQNHPLIIDFGLSIDLKGLKHNDDYKKAFYVYSPDYYLWCPEIQVLSYLYTISDKPTKTEYKNIAIECVKYNKGLHNGVFNTKDIDDYRNELIKELQSYYGKSRHEVTKSILDKSSHTWDNYSLSILFLKIIGYIIDGGDGDGDGGDGADADGDGGDGGDNNNFLLFFSQLLLQNIHPNPKKRHTIENTLSLFDGFFYKDNKDVDKMYVNILNSIQTVKDNNMFSLFLQKDESKLLQVSKRVYDKIK
jgi:serine/threonine protein kinase